MSGPVFDPGQIRPMIIEMNGNLVRVSQALGCDSEELRDFVYSTPLLRRALDEVVARGVDLAVSVLFAGLEDEHLGNRLMAAKTMLKSRAGARRGFTSGADLTLKTPREGGTLSLTWLPPEAPAGPPMIEGTVEKEG